MKMDRRVWLQKHILAMVYVMGILFGVMVLRYAWLQLVAGDELSERMRSQVGYDLAIQSPRGTITDRNGREMAVSLMTKSLYIDPNHVSDPDALASDLAPLINMPEQEILDDISAGGGFVWVKRRMEHDEYEAVRKMVREKSYTDCVGFRDEAKRYYPNDILGANVLGFVGTDDKGLDGIEQGLDGLLKGEVKEKYLTTDRQNRPILDSIFSSQRQYKGEYCKNVELTLDAGIQFIVEQELDRAMAENNPQAITCVVMNPKTGEVLAMASRPSYNPNSFYDYSPEVWKNRAVSFIYEPGSTFSRSSPRRPAGESRLAEPGLRRPGLRHGFGPPHPELERHELRHRHLHRCRQAVAQHGLCAGRPAPRRAEAHGLRQALRLRNADGHRAAGRGGRPALQPG